MSLQQTQTMSEGSNCLAETLGRIASILGDTNMTLDEQFEALLQMISESDDLQQMLEEIGKRLSEQIQKFKEELKKAGDGTKVTWEDIQALVGNDETKKVLFVLAAIIITTCGGGATIYSNWTYIGPIVKSFIVNVSTVPSIAANFPKLKVITAAISSSPAFAALWQKFQVGQMVSPMDLWGIGHDGFSLAFKLAPTFFGILSTETTKAGRGGCVLT